ncbi:hypothetical protein FIBSPDRAFT_854079 [Athelia psychrophila]|uniref:Uncharacterized protein n=1 Tax=Athelia psychrophila TaxID=1759441 RepID=A0A166QJP2_9AGAM|nr:hypothetical protein FIBSPDRAFT_854079 [Fibularhizoctonia sp. CBS 109695]
MPGSVLKLVFLERLEANSVWLRSSLLHDGACLGGPDASEKHVAAPGHSTVHSGCHFTCIPLWRHEHVKVESERDAIKMPKPSPDQLRSALFVLLRSNHPT